MDFAQLINAGTVAALLWAARTMLEITRIQAVHEEKHKVTEHRLKKLEDHKATHCPHN